MDENIKDIQIFLQAMKKDHLSREDFTKAFQDLVDVIVDTRNKLTEDTDSKNGSTKAEIEQSLSIVKSTLDTAISQMRAKVAETENTLRSDARTTLRMLEERIADVKKSIPNEYNDTEIRDILSDIHESMPEMPEEFDATEILKKITELEKEIDALKKRPVGSGGGVTNMRIIQAFKYILKTEAPVGNIDGLNTTYTVSQPIFAVLGMTLNGETIAQLPNYTIAGKTITFSTALTSAYSGKGFEIKFI